MKLSQLYEDSTPGAQGSVQNALEELRQTANSLSSRIDNELNDLYAAKRGWEKYSENRKKLTGINLKNTLKGEEKHIGSVINQAQNLADTVATIGLAARNVQNLLKQPAQQPAQQPAHFESLRPGLAALLLREAGERLPDYFSASLEGPEQEPERESERVPWQNVEREIHGEKVPGGKDLPGYKMDEASRKLAEVWKALIEKWPLKRRIIDLLQSPFRDDQQIEAAVGQVYKASVDLVALIEMIRELAVRIKKEGGTKVTTGEAGREGPDIAARQERRREWEQERLAQAQVEKQAGGTPSPTTQVSQTPEERTKKLAGQLANLGVGGDLDFRREAVRQAQAANPNADDEEIVTTAFDLFKKKAVVKKQREPYRVTLDKLFGNKRY